MGVFPNLLHLTKRNLYYIPDTLNINLLLLPGTNNIIDIGYRLCVLDCNIFLGTFNGPDRMMFYDSRFNCLYFTYLKYMSEASRPL